MHHTRCRAGHITQSLLASLASPVVTVSLRHVQRQCLVLTRHSTLSTAAFGRPPPRHNLQVSTSRQQTTAIQTTTSCGLCKQGLHTHGNGHPLGASVPSFDTRAWSKAQEDIYFRRAEEARREEKELRAAMTLLEAERQAAEAVNRSRPAPPPDGYEEAIDTTWLNQQVQAWIRAVLYVASGRGCA